MARKTSSNGSISSRERKCWTWLAAREINPFPPPGQGAEVIGLDIATNLLEQARKRAADEKLKIEFVEGDAEKLPYEAARFDVVLSMFGAMFAPRPDVVASELVRVCRPGGLIAMGNWTPDGFVGQMFKITADTRRPRPACRRLRYGETRRW